MSRERKWFDENSVYHQYAMALHTANTYRRFLK